MGRCMGVPAGCGQGGLRVGRVARRLLRLRAGRAAGGANGAKQTRTRHQAFQSQARPRPFSCPPPQTSAPLPPPTSQIKLGPERALPLIRFRGVVRPVIVAGDRSFVERAVRAAEPLQAQLRARGVSGAPPRRRGLHMRVGPPVWARPGCAGPVMQAGIPTPRPPLHHIQYTRTHAHFTTAPRVQWCL